MAERKGGIWDDPFVPSEQPALREYYHARNFFLSTGTEKFGVEAVEEWRALTREQVAEWVQRAKDYAAEIASLPSELQEAVARDGSRAMLEQNDSHLESLGPEPTDCDICGHSFRPSPSAVDPLTTCPGCGAEIANPEYYPEDLDP